MSDGFTYSPAVVVSSRTMADPSEEDYTTDPAKASRAVPLSLMSHPSTVLKQFHHPKRARVEDIIQGMSGPPKTRAPREEGRSDGASRDGGKLIQGHKRKGGLHKNHSYRLGGGTCCGKGKELRELREQLWALQGLIKEFQQQGFLQGDQLNSSQACDQEKGETGLLVARNSKRETDPPEGSDCKHRTRQDKEDDGRFSKNTAYGVQIPQEGNDYLLLNKGYENLPETLKQELSQAMNKSVDLVFENLSPALFGQSRQAYVKQVPFPNYKKPSDEILMPRRQEPSLDKEERLAVAFQKKSKLPPAKGQSEALSFVTSNPALIHCPSLNQMAKRPRHSLQAPLHLSRQSSVQEKAILEQLTNPPIGNLASLPCKNQAVDQVSQDSIAWAQNNVKPKVISTYVDRQAHPVTLGAEAVGSPCRPRAFISRDIQAVVERNFFMAANEGLNPNHLKKAKLIFFYCRYPNANLLKTFFPDIKFNRCVTSQLIKWFSNFREFFYIQMEKFSRQCIINGVNRESDLSVTRDSELFRSLNMHFNKANDFQVPSRFLEVSEITLREFFNAISLAKDQDPSWKKAIYKVICKLDSDVPEVFKSTICW